MKTKFFKVLSLTTTIIVLSGCAVLHKVQVGQVDNRSGTSAVPFEILVSEAGVSTEDIKAIGLAARSRDGDNLAGVAQIIALFQMGPRTGNPVYAPRYAEKLIYEIHNRCPSGRVTGLMSVREMRKYPVISGEIVKIKGYCLRDRQPASESDSIEEVEL